MAMLVKTARFGNVYCTPSKTGYHVGRPTEKSLCKKDSNLYAKRGNCPQFGHIAKSYPEESFCKVEICRIGGKHLTFLHIKNDGEKLLGNIESLSTQVTTKNGYINRVSLCCSTSAGMTQGTGMPTVPVQVKAKDYSSPVEVYTFLGPRFNTTFCTKPLIK